MANWRGTAANRMSSRGHRSARYMTRVEVKTAARRLRREESKRIARERE